MPAASHLQGRGGHACSSTFPAEQLASQLDLQTPSSPLRQHLDPEALPRPDYFDSLDDLHLWYQMQYGDVLQDHLELCSKHVGPPRASSSRTTSSIIPATKLAVCHDFKGGYTEEPSKRGYTLEHMHLVDTFIYFSHKRVSIPPISWLSAASRSGTKVLGTLIFEWEESIPDVAKLLRGPERKAMPLRGEPCFSPQYAVELIQLALDRGFSGYLVNIEVGLDLGFSCSGEAWPAWVGEQARIGEMRRNAERLRGWLHFLREEGTRQFIEAGKEADEWEVMWYDSVVYPHGQLAWQDALTEHNTAFFQSAHTFFTNYTWARPPQPLPPGQLIDPNDRSPQTLQLHGYGLTGPQDGGLHPHLLKSVGMAANVGRPCDEVFVGIDVFGRNCWGGLKSWKSFDMVGPHRRANNQALGLSVALFAPGWTWEDENAGLTLQLAQSSQERSWSEWWHVDEAFWTGGPPALTPAKHRIALSQHDIKPVQRYYGHSNLGSARQRRRADPLGFYTNFSFGSGTKWFDRGDLVYEWSNHQSSSETQSSAGFTDMGASMPKPDALYAEWHRVKERDSIPYTTSWKFDEERVWAGTASLAMTCVPVAVTEDEYQVLLPLCSAVLPCLGEKDTVSTDWQLTIVYDAATRNTGVEIMPWISPISGSHEVIGPTLSSTTHEDLGQGWAAATYRFRIPPRSDFPSEKDDYSQDSSFMALNIGVQAQCGTAEAVQLWIGALQLAPCPAPCPSSSSVTSSALQVLSVADIFESVPPSNAQTRRLQATVLSWTAPTGVLASMYYNVWVQAVDKPETRTWLGTSTREATLTEFCLPDNLVLPPQLAQAEETGLEFVVTSLDILSPIEVAKGRASVI
ncbi:related to Endo-b-N-acetylglucosaminidase [Ustilago trichophora]|uniref:Related to Endo-b-N-acetylglucosaminidase n=1 Tax=Ustilago trichophora TaxID=86804 RepID=A0A5C3DXN2_9BASI|nr:related to Endo-b-N-acetylglucosaminidase [Ustilago trichophora]